MVKLAILAKSAVFLLVGQGQCRPTLGLFLWTTQYGAKSVITDSFGCQVARHRPEGVARLQQNAQSSPRGTNYAVCAFAEGNLRYGDQASSHFNPCQWPAHTWHRAGALLPYTLEAGTSGLVHFWCAEQMCSSLSCPVTALAIPALPPAAPLAAVLYFLPIL